ncbi:conserved hypothetical protein [Talaromyces stipitatus ATCC 10500]|uniref:Adipose-regulatory protein n=1 Tax=Talaromyces stipitatus (strain ATCC 10500 / CBS 375.48 / QM 6759 / NRRL 1006) TaxID=441959 RepID=B8M7I5_TALSN|nr:uncharacterized protein TSTA_028270 [Talaromyces stipitatus ATCC 10500]EED19538.1 conserved hypothetical protein [Talaromyces stipitatus ATCC 10500]
MGDKDSYSDDEDEYEQEESVIWKAAVSGRLPEPTGRSKANQREKKAVFTPFRALFSKEAQKTYLGAILFISTSIVLFCVAAVAYWAFYLNYVPQIGLKRVVHLQFGEYPWGIATLGSDLASLQQYDVSVSLKLPRTPANLATGNFMLDLALHSPPQDSIIGANTSTSLIAHSRRPAILTYTSPLVDTAHTLSRMPLYVIGWQREAETLDVPMFEDIEFARGWRNVPASLRLEIQSREQMQVYGVEVNFRAKFRGLRWLMYRWRFLSFFAFTSMFWSVSMASSSIAWLLFSQYLSSATPDDQRIKKEEPEDNNTTTIKKEFGESQSVKQEEIEETTNIPPLGTQSGNEVEDVESIRNIHDNNNSGRGTAFDGHDTLGAQRRRSHFPE